MTTMEERTQAVGAAWGKILEQSGYKHDPCYNLSNKPEVAQKIGELVFDYMTASIHDMDWEGFSEEDIQGIQALLEDMELFAKNQ